MLTIILIHVQRGRASGIRPRFLFVSLMLPAWKESHRRESDSWPLPYQGSALPLSYCGLCFSHSLLRTFLFRCGERFCSVSAILERKTGLEPATYSLEGYRSTKWATSAFVKFGFVGEGGLEPPNSSEDRFTVCCNCRYATPPVLLSDCSVFRGPDLEPMKGLEPPTGWLQISYSTNWVTSASVNLSNNSFSRRLRLQKYYFFQIPQRFFSFFFFTFSQTIDFLNSISRYFFTRFPSMPCKTSPPLPFSHQNRPKNVQNSPKSCKKQNKTL